MSAFDELQRQLLDSVARRQESPADRAASLTNPTAGAVERQTRRPGPGSRWLRARDGAQRRRWLVLVAIPLVFVAAAAAAKIVAQSSESP
jgi:hypothetical protein